MTFKVSIVEDDPDVADILALSFQSVGFETQVINNGKDAVAKMKEFEPQVVIMDLELGDGPNGTQVLQQMSFDSHLKHVIVVANTIHMDSNDNLGASYWYYYQQTRREDPVMINKSMTDSEKVDIRIIVGELISQKYGGVPKPLYDWLMKQNKGPAVQKWSLI
ncbi:MAG: hypothetical protein KCHDKBKB_02159 [Elusimicrobia bacterium]|nr:hypothetical protein [Elusimicrobiota bacterium]